MSVRTKEAFASKRREAVAYHEAGHAVVAHMLGYQVRRVLQRLAAKVACPGVTASIAALAASSSTVVRRTSIE
jgi:ATP-dependent Zn protease